MSNADFWNRIARKYAKHRISNMPAYEQTLEHVRRHLRPQDQVLEVGGGTGSTAILLAPSVSHYTGTDYAEEMIAIAQEKLTADPVAGLEFMVAEADLEAVAAESKDVVLAFNLYHLVPDLNAAIAAANRVLKPGGLLITKTPCLGKKWYLRPVIKAMQLVGKAPQVAFLTNTTLENAFTGAGFDILETEYYAANTNNRFVVARKR